MELQASVVNAGLCEPDGERDLIERAKRDRQAFAQIYRSHYPAIAGYIARRIGDVHVAEDLTAEVFVIALRTLPRFRYRGIPLRVWLYRLASNSVSRWVRRNRKRVLQSLAEDAAAPAADPDAAADTRRVRLALLALHTRYQTVLALHHLEGMPLEQVAQAIGCRLGTVKSRLNRGRSALREQLLPWR